MNDIYTDARERERDRRINNLGLPCTCWVILSRFGCCRGKSPLAAAHIVWILYDILITATILLLAILFGSADKYSGEDDERENHDAGFWMIFILVHLIWNLICLCSAWNSGKKPYDFLLCSCIDNACGAILHFIVMLAGAGPFIILAVFGFLDFFIRKF